MQIMPAFLPIETPNISPPETSFMGAEQHSPGSCSTMFFRPEYGFELLLEASPRLKKQYPKIGCLVMGER